jgi:DnaJ-class molecular chaperone
MAEDHYKTLGVRREASQTDIQKAYYELAKKYHPDKNPGDKSAKKKFQQIQAAFDVLSNPEKREMYDRYGSSFETMGAGGPQGGPAWQTWQGAPGGAPGGATFEDVDFGQFFGERYGQEMPGGLGDIFAQFRRAGGGKRKSAAAAAGRGADLVQQVEIPFTTSITGGELAITVQHHSGKTETISVKIPAGVEEGKKIRVRGHGEPGPRGGTPGDILITIRVAAHPFFTRRGNDLYVKVPVTLAEALLGAKVDVPTPSGTVALKIPAGTSSGTRLRVKQHGVATKEGTSGDLFAEVQIVLPKNLSETDRQAIRDIAERYPQEPRHNLRWQAEQ